MGRSSFYRTRVRSWSELGSTEKGHGFADPKDAFVPEFRFREPMSDVELPPNARLVYYWLRTLKDDDGYCYARMSEIAKRVGISEDACGTKITELERAGYISREIAQGLGTGRRRYKIVGLFAAMLTSAAIGLSAPATAASLDTVQGTFHFPATE